MSESAGLPGQDMVATLHEDVEALYRSWHILDLVGETADELPREWLQILNIARTLMGGRPLTGVTVPEELQRLLRPAEPLYTTRIRSQHRRRVVYPVTGDTEVQPLRHLADFPQITLPDLMLRNISRELFDYRLLSGNMNGVYNIDTGPAVQEWDELVEERVPTDGMTRRRRQRVYVLFDVSNSMRDANKIIFAKALVLAYLLTAAGERAQLHFRTFANSIHRRTDALDPGGFGEIARRVLEVSPDGSTDIHTAIAAAVGDINALDGVGQGLRRPFEQSPTELLLVSDCESYLVPQVPKGIQLHTVHLKGGPMMKGYQAGFEEIRAASATFHEIDTTLLALPATTRDRWLLLQDGRQITAIDLAEDGDDERRASRTERRKALLNVYARMAEPGKSQDGAVRQRPGDRGAVQRIPIGAAFRALWARFRQLLGADRPRRAKPATAAAGFGVQFRQRRP